MCYVIEIVNKYTSFDYAISIQAMIPICSTTSLHPLSLFTLHNLLFLRPITCAVDIHHWVLMRCGAAQTTQEAFILFSKRPRGALDML